MDHSSGQHQEMQTHSLENKWVCSKAQQERMPRPQPEEAVKCPRCESTTTKFCYYNNYSLSQPRYFCKSCRRYWTKGGTLRNVPMGGGCRKSKRSSWIMMFGLLILALISLMSLWMYHAVGTIIISSSSSNTCVMKMATSQLKLQMLCGGSSIPVLLQMR